MRTPLTRIVSGIADYPKESRLVDSVAFIRRVDYRSDPRRWTLLTRPTKESGSVVTDLPVAGDRVVDTTYIHGNGGNIYTRTLAGAVTLVKTVANSHGNGMEYFGEDDYLYYTSDRLIGRYGRISGTPTFVDDFLGSEGGIPLNTNSLDLEAGSSHYATAADSASLSITGDISLEAYTKMESLPTAGNEMILVSKWNENSNQRSYKMAIAAISGFFGDGSDGALTISSDTTEAPTDSACTGTSGAYTLSATNAAFAASQRVLIHQTRGTGAGTYQLNTIVSYTAGTITLQDPLNADYVSGAQVRVLKQYSAVTINSAKTYSAKAWNGTVGGILAFLCNGTVTVTGTITASVKGFRGGVATGGSGTAGSTGEGTAGASVTPSTSANGNGGSGGLGTAGRGGSGGGLANVGSAHSGANGGAIAGNADLTNLVFGGGGGSAGTGNSGAGSSGGVGGGILFIGAVTLTVAGAITNAGGAGISGYYGGGGGAGGSILLRCQTATLGTALITAAAGAAGGGSTDPGFAGSVGRIHLDYITSYSGSTTPNIDAAQDTDLGGNTAYHLRFYVSSDGTAVEYYSKEITSLAIGTWIRPAVAWDASASTAYLYADAVLLGSATGAMTAIYNGTALLGVGADFNSAGSARSFLDGLVDDIRVWSDIRDITELAAYRQLELGGNEANLVAYYQVDASASDSTANANNLTLVNSPAYSSEVPFSAPTTRLDIDQEDTSTGDTYAVGTSIDEGASNRQTFVPAKDPQKSISINVNAVGTTCNWTLTVHDPLNKTVASATILNANMHTGVIEFIFSDVWTPVIGASYHFHLTVTNTTGTPKAVAGTNNNLETGQFKSYYQFLVTDTQFHPISQIVNQKVFGNGRYLATWDASSYDPHRLTFPSTYKVRCFAKWREFIAIGLWRGSAIEDYDQGMIFFWDGYSPTYNFFIDVPQGGINAMFGSAGTLYIIAGYQGDLLEYTGGDKAKKIKRLPNLAKSEQVEILPGAMTMWQTLLRIGAGVTDSTTFEQGTYSYGAINEDYPDSLSYDYYISTGSNVGTSVQIGLLLPVKKKLLVGWKDGVSYGLDSIDLSGDPVDSGSIEFVIRDEDAIYKEKQLQLVRADFEPLNSGESVGLQYKLDRDSAWTTEQTTTSSSTETDRNRLQVQNGRHKEYQLRVNLYTSVSTSPAVLGITPDENLLETESVI